MKLWKTTVNNWGWDAPKTLYFASREDAEKAYRRYPAADRVEYAGNYTQENADRLIEYTQDELTTGQHW